MSVSTTFERFCEIRLQVKNANVSTIDAQIAALQHQKAVVELEYESSVFEKRIELEAHIVESVESVPTAAAAAFISKRKDELEADDLEFLAEDHRGVVEVAAYLGVSESTVKRHARSGCFLYEIHKVRRQFRFDTVSVVRYLLDAKTEEES